MLPQTKAKMLGSIAADGAYSLAPGASAIDTSPTPALASYWVLGSAPLASGVRQVTRYSLLVTRHSLLVTPYSKGKTDDPPQHCSDGRAFRPGAGEGGHLRRLCRSMEHQA